MKPAAIITPKAIDFKSYMQLITELSDKNSCTGELTDDHIEATHLNAQRVKRIAKQAEIKPELKALIESVEDEWEWIILIESWCGDGAQNLPILAKMAELSKKITLSILFRDENPELMNAHLTNGSRSIPKLICKKTKTGAIIGTWGPRPAAIQEMVTKFKAENPAVPYKEFSYNLQLWYSRDRGESLQNEFMKFISEWKNTSSKS